MYSKSGSDKEKLSRSYIINFFLFVGLNINNFYVNELKIYHRKAQET